MAAWTHATRGLRASFWSSGVSGNPVPGYEVPIPAGGSEKVEIAQRKAGDPMVVTIYISDAAGNLTDVYQWEVSDSNPASPTCNQTVRPHTTYVYDQSGDEILQVTADEQAAFQAWVSSGHSPASFTGGTAWTFDQNGDQLTRTLPDGEQESSTYNVYNQVFTHTDFDGNTATYTYYTVSDPGVGAYLGSLHQVVYGGALNSGKATETVTYTYTTLGQQQTVTDASGTTTISYDPEGDVTVQDTPEGIIHHAFDPATGELIHTWTAYTDIGYGYNDLGELTTTSVNELNGIVLKDSQGSPAPLITTDTYDPAGNKSTETLPNGVVTSWTDDDLNRLIGMSEMLGTTVLFSQSFTLNDNGTRASSLQRQLQPDGTSITTDTLWSNDALGRLTQEALTNDSNPGLSYTDQFTYDLVGNRLTSTHAGPGNGPDETINNTYNGDDQLTKEVSTLSGETDLKYDAYGSLTTSGPPSNPFAETYGYDVRNKMVSADVNGVTSSDVYNDDGDRAAETVDGTTTYYLIDDDNPTGYSQVLEARPSPTGAPNVTYVIGGSILGQVDGSGNVSYLLTDGHNSTRALANSSGVVTATFNFDASGDLLGVTYAPSSPPPTVYLYDQQQLDVALGQYQLRARIYDPAVGGFTSLDPETHAPGDTLGANPYIYADDSPLELDDPSGAAAISNAIFGTYVHSFLARAFEDFTPIIGGFGLSPGPRLPRGPGISGSLQRWGNRQIRSIATGISGVPLPRVGSLIFRPDFVELNTATGSGDIYELKPAELEDLLNPGFAASTAAQLWTYRGLLTLFAPSVSWSFGTTWASGLTVWPTFMAPGLPTGSTLITFDDYSVAPGAIFYDIVGLDDAAELAAVAASAGIGAAAAVAAEASAVAGAEITAAAMAVQVANAANSDVLARVGFEALIPLAP